MNFSKIKLSFAVLAAFAIQNYASAAQNSNDSWKQSDIVAEERGNNRGEMNRNEGMNRGQYNRNDLDRNDRGLNSAELNRDLSNRSLVNGAAAAGSYNAGAADTYYQNQNANPYGNSYSPQPSSPIIINNQ